MIRSHTFIAIPPGATIKEQLFDRGLSQKEFALRMNLSEKHVSKLINGEVQLTPDVAVRLEMVLGVPAKFWNGLEATYREKIVKINNENDMENDIEIAKKLPYAEMVKLGWINKTNNWTEKVINLRKFFEVTSLELIQEPKISKIAYRKLSSDSKSDYALITWAQKAKLEARKIETKLIDLQGLTSNLDEIRSMTRLEPEIFCSRLKDIFANNGIALVFLPHIGGSFLHGATFMDGNKIVIGLTVRGKDADKFWFSLFHELGHVLQGHITQLVEITEEDELKCDLFARDILILPEDYTDFVAKRDFTKNAIYLFAESINIDCGIVIGRLQKDGYLKYSQYNDMKTKYEIL